MSWIALTTEDVLSEFTLQEAASLRNLQGSGSGSGAPYANIDIIVINVIDEVRGYIMAGGYDVDPIEDDTIPSGLFVDAIAIARWRILIAVPMLKQLQTEERGQAFDKAIEKLLLISNRKFTPEPIPGGLTVPRGGNWNSENKLIMRAHPIPRPATQFTPQTNTYANPTGPADTTNTQTTGTLVIGTSYTILLYVTGDDFENVGGTNETGSVFTATGTTPTTWTNGSQLQA